MQDIAAIATVDSLAAGASSAPSRPSIPSLLSLRITPFDRFMAVAMASLILVELLLFRICALASPSLSALVPWTECKIVLTLAIFCYLYPTPRLAQTIPLLLWSALWANPLQVLVLLAARSPFPLVDNRLAAIDHALHISTAAIHAPFAGPPFLTFSILIYALFFPLLIAPVVLPCLYGLPGAARRFVLGSALGIAIGALIFVFLPAIGPWASEPMRPGSLQLTMGNYLLRLKSRTPMPMDLGRSAIVSFPSEHVVIALLAARALAILPSLRRWAWPIAALVCCSTITTGWHYGIDVLGGIAVAALSAWLADTICTRLEMDPSPQSTFAVAPLP